MNTGNPVVSFIDSNPDRRIFTINRMFLSPTSGQVADFAYFPTEIVHSGQFR